MAEKNKPTVPTEDGWITRRQGAQRASSTHAVKSEAQLAGRAALIKVGFEHLTPKKDPTIAIRNSYGSDTAAAEGTSCVGGTDDRRGDQR